MNVAELKSFADFAKKELPDFAKDVVKNYKPRFKLHYDGLGELFDGKRSLTRREWKGVKDTAYDFGRWCKLYTMIVKNLVIPAPIQTIEALLQYRWMVSYLTAAAFIDRHTLGLTGYELRYCHEQFYAVMQNSVKMLSDMFVRDINLNGDSKKAAELRKKTVMLDEMMPTTIMAGFPNLIGIPMQMAPVFEAGEVDQNANIPYIDIAENYGIAADICPLPASEVGAILNNEIPIFGDYMIVSSMPCDGSVIASMYTEKVLKIPTFQITPPQRFNEPETLKYAVKNIKAAIKWIEEQTGETWDWNAFFENCKRHNIETECVIDKWDINCTPYPQICGAALALHREFEFQIAGSRDPYFAKNDQKVRDLMFKGFEHDKELDIKPKYRAIVWSCPAHYYSNFTFWAQNCWGIKTLVDMECMLTHHFYDTQDKEKSIEDMTIGYEKMTMRSHSNGGYVNALDECWKMCEKFDANIVIMYNHVSCKNFGGLQGLFEDQARERGIHLIWVEHDLMDPRTVSRKSMRDKVNRYMTTVFNEKPLDPSLVDYDDDITW